MQNNSLARNLFGEYFSFVPFQLFHYFSEKQKSKYMSGLAVISYVQKTVSLYWIGLQGLKSVLG
jgi:hypothetical protein